MTTSLEIRGARKPVGQPPQFEDESNNDLNPSFNAIWPEITQKVRRRLSESRCFFNTRPEVRRLRRTDRKSAAKDFFGGTYRKNLSERLFQTNSRPSLLLQLWGTAHTAQRTFSYGAREIYIAWTNLHVQFCFLLHKPMPRLS